MSNFYLICQSNKIEIFKSSFLLDFWGITIQASCPSRIASFHKYLTIKISCKGNYRPNRIDRESDSESNNILGPFSVG